MLLVVALHHASASAAPLPVVAPMLLVVALHHASV
jgi:hypothetical protein